MEVKIRFNEETEKLNKYYAKWIENMPKDTDVLSTVDVDPNKELHYVYDEDLSDIANNCFMLAPVKEICGQDAEYKIFKDPTVKKAVEKGFPIEEIGAPHLNCPQLLARHKYYSTGKKDYPEEERFEFFLMVEGKNAHLFPVAFSEEDKKVLTDMVLNTIEKSNKYHNLTPAYADNAAEEEDKDTEEERE